jgi:hypothetical protein
MTAIRSRLRRLGQSYAASCRGECGNLDDQRLAGACSLLPSAVLRVLLAACAYRAAGQLLTAEMLHAVEQLTATMEMGVWAS